MTSLFDAARYLVMHEGRRDPLKWLGDDGVVRIPRHLSPERAWRSLTVSLSTAREALDFVSAHGGETTRARRDVEQLERTITAIFGSYCLQRIQDGPLDPAWAQHAAMMMLAVARADFEKAMREHDERTMTECAEAMDRLERMIRTREFAPTLPFGRDRRSFQARR